MMARAVSLSLDPVRAVFGSRLQERVVLSNYTTSRTGGPADGLLVANTAGELAETAGALWGLDVPFFILGSGSNVLVSDAGVRGVVVINRARNIKIDTHHPAPSVWAESGANLGTVARQAALRGFSGLEWAGTVPGSLGGAVYGNAGAHGGDMAGSLVLAEILHRESGREAWPVERLEYAYRTSALKRQPGQAVILAARLKLSPASPETVKATMEQFSAQRRRSQPPGASMGSMFKNPPGDYAGRLIEAAGLKGRRIGDAEISAFHANFFINHGNAAAADIYRLIQAARQAVQDKFGIALELEVELLGDWSKANE
jgi:UDP-N-acetylmuramate dehydrogenase